MVRKVYAREGIPLRVLLEKVDLVLVDNCIPGYDMDDPLGKEEGFLDHIKQARLPAELDYNRLLYHQRHLRRLIAIGEDHDHLTTVRSVLREYAEFNSQYTRAYDDIVAKYNLLPLHQKNVLNGKMEGEALKNILKLHGDFYALLEVGSQPHVSNFEVVRELSAHMQKANLHLGVFKGGIRRKRKGHSVLSNGDLDLASRAYALSFQGKKVAVLTRDGDVYNLIRGAGEKLGSYLDSLSPVREEVFVFKPSEEGWASKDQKIHFWGSSVVPFGFSGCVF
jgi:hypothetical protein